MLRSIEGVESISLWISLWSISNVIFASSEVTFLSTLLVTLLKKSPQFVFFIHDLNRLFKFTCKTCYCFLSQVFSVTPFTFIWDCNPWPPNWDNFGIFGIVHVLCTFEYFAKTNTEAQSLVQAKKLSRIHIVCLFQNVT